MSCDKFEELLVLYLDKKLSPGKSREIEQHLKECKRCSGTLNELKKTIGLIETLPELDAPPELVEKTINRIEKVQLPASAKVFLQKVADVFRPPIIRVLIPALAVFLIFVMIDIKLKKEKLLCRYERPDKTEERTAKIFKERMEEKSNLVAKKEKSPEIVLQGKDIQKIAEVFFASAESVPKKSGLTLAGRDIDKGQEAESRILDEMLDRIKTSIIEITPEVKEIFHRWFGRLRDIKTLKVFGVVGESNEGFLKILKNKEEISEENKKIIFEENSDRKKMLKIFARQYINKKNVAPQYSPLIKKEIKKIAAKIQRELSSPGEWVQNPSGEWTEKK